MKASTSKLSRMASVCALGAVLFTTTSCDEKDKNPLSDICPGLECPDQGVAEGNASITGTIAIDSFFKSVVNFKGVAAGVAADIQTELDGIQGSFGISNKDLATAGGKLSTAIKTKLTDTFKAKLVVKAQPAKCEIDASFSAQVTAECQAQANCDVDPGKATVECMGTCTVEASAEAKCDANAEVVCNVSGPQVACSGSCEGTCTASASATAKCEGTCAGTCTGGCDGTLTGGKCDGKCTGTCSADCQLTGEAALKCDGSCNGSCSYKPAMASCTADAKVECSLKAEAKAECKGHCDGEVIPPKVDCDASASCEASAKAEAKFQAKCTPPSMSITFTSTATDPAIKAQFEFAMADLKVRLPRLAAALKKADLVVKAGTELGGDGAKAVKATLSGFAKGDVDFVAAYRIGSCAPDELNASAKVITDSGKDLAGKVSAANDVTAAVGMGT